MDRADDRSAGLAKWLARNASAEEASGIIAYSTRCVTINLTTAIALKAAELNRDYKLVTADAIIYATALSEDAELLTCDAHFADLPHIVYLPNR